jgi:hypothetical protein
MERELFKLLSAELGITVKRELRQSRDGGQDADGLPGWAVECKAVRSLSRPKWWVQAIHAAGEDRIPALFYRRDLAAFKPGQRITDAWLAVVPAVLLPAALHIETIEPLAPAVRGAVCTFHDAVRVIHATL